jgi:hypothetical protein
MGRLGHLGAQLKADLPNTGGTAGRMRMECTRAAEWRVLRDFSAVFMGISHQKLVLPR